MANALHTVANLWLPLFEIQSSSGETKPNGKMLRLQLLKGNTPHKDCWGVFQPLEGKAGRMSRHGKRRLEHLSTSQLPGRGYLLAQRPLPRSPENGATERRTEAPPALAAHSRRACGVWHGQKAIQESFNTVRAQTYAALQRSARRRPLPSDVVRHKAPDLRRPTPPHQRHSSHPHRSAKSTNKGWHPVLAAEPTPTHPHSLQAVARPSLAEPPGRTHAVPKATPTGRRRARDLLLQPPPLQPEPRVRNSGLTRAGTQARRPVRRHP